MNNIIKRKWNQNSMVIIEDLQGMAFQAESGGHTFQISGIDGEGNAVALSGTPAGVMLRSDGQDVTLTCSVSGGVVSATLPANAYSVPGRFGLTIFLTSDGQKTAIYAAVGTVGKTSSGTVAPPAGSNVVDLVNAIAAAVATIPASYTDLMASIAPTYSSSGLYAVGSYAWYNGKLYRCTTAITSGETWTSGHWTLANLGSDLVDLKSALSDTNKAVIDAFAPQGSKTTITLTSGYYMHKTAGKSANADASITDPITMYPGQVLFVENVKGNGNYALLSLVNQNGGFISSIINGNSGQTVRSPVYQNTTSNIQYVVVSTVSGLQTSVKVSDPDIIGYYNELNSLEGKEETECSYVRIGHYFNTSLVKAYNTDTSATAITQPIHLKVGEQLYVSGWCLNNVNMIAECDQFGNPSLAILNGSGSKKTYTLIADHDMYVVITVDKNNAVPIINKRKTAYNPQTNQNNFNLVMPVVSFIFDDGYSEDANAVALFNAHGKKCSFALISTITTDTRVNEYLKYQKMGFEILSHSTDGRTMNGYSGADITDESVAVACMLDSKEALLDAGFDIHGWVTPSGRLKPAWVADVKPLYDYGFCLTNMTYDDAETQTPYFTKAGSAYSDIVRVSLEDTSIAMCKSAVDAAIANRGMIVFYGHKVQETASNNLTIAFLEELLTYIDGKKGSLLCLPCNTAMRYFFKVTHEDFITA